MENSDSLNITLKLTKEEVKELINLLEVGFDEWYQNISTDRELFEDDGKIKELLDSVKRQLQEQI